MTLHLDLLRHGETELGGGLRGSLDDALTARGWEQMHAAVATGGPWDRLVSSPLQRCARFAEQLGRRLNIPVHLDADLQELHFGAWEGRSAAALMDTDAEALGRFWADPYEFTPPDGEPVQEQSVAECHEGPRRRHGVGDTDGDQDPLSPPLELASLPPQRFAKLRVVGEFEEEGVACAGARGESPGLQFGHRAQALDQLGDPRDRGHRRQVEVGALALGDPVDDSAE